MYKNDVSCPDNSMQCCPVREGRIVCKMRRMERSVQDVIGVAEGYIGERRIERRPESVNNFFSFYYIISFFLSTPPKKKVLTEGTLITDLN